METTLTNMAQRAQVIDCEEVGCVPKVHRETAKGILERQVADLETKLAGKKHLLLIVSKLEAGTPAEQVLWELLVNQRSR